MTRKDQIIKAGRGFRILGFLFLEMILGSAGLQAQQYTTDKEVSNAYSHFRSQYIQEKLYVHTDKSSYVSGEICWFRIYYADAFSNKPASTSKIAYVEILDKNNRPVLQEKVSLKPGETGSSVVIPGEIASGTYIFRAYTNWMKNFGPSYFFEKAIRIINPRNLQQDSSIAKKSKYDIQFFPEGGNLVQQIETKVAFRITDAFGRGLEFEGMLMNSAGDTVLRFHPLHKGLGNFVFTPLPGQNYKALIRFPQGNTEVKELPDTYKSGYVFSLSRNPTGQVTATVRSSADLEDLEIYMVIHGKQKMLPVKTGKLTGRTYSFVIEIKDLEDGISQFTLFTSRGEPVCERLIFKYPENQFLITAETNAEYKTRDKINVNLSALDQEGKPVAADMSLAVYRIDSLQNADESNIRDYMYLSSELGPFESPAFYFEENGKSREADMDNLMLTHGWRRYNWKDMLRQKPVNIEFSPEYNGHIINGKVVNNKTGAAVPQTQAYLSVPSSRTQFRSTTSNAAGRIKFEMTGFYGSQELIVQTNPKTDSAAHIEIDNPFLQKYSDFRPPDFFIPSKYSPTLLDQSIHEQVQHVYNAASLNHSVLQSVDTNFFYVEPDEKYMLDDYTRFQTMEEVFREYVHSLIVYRRKDSFQLYLFDRPANKLFADEPMILIDGVPFFYATELIRQDPMKIRRIDLVNRQYALGYQIFYGIINLTTYKGNLEGIELDPHVTVLDYPGIPEEREFFSPRYETEEQINSRMPDYRTLLYWKPQIKSDGQGKNQISFYSSDLPGRYALVVQGLTNNGEPGSGTFFFNVKK